MKSQVYEHFKSRYKKVGSGLDKRWAYNRRTPSGASLEGLEKARALVPPHTQILDNKYGKKRWSGWK